MADNNVPELTNGEFEKFIGEGEVTFIDFFAEWCMPCMMMSPLIDDLAEEFEEKVNFGKVNIEDNQEIASKYNISSLPTFVLFKEGKVLDQLSGAKTQEELSEFINKYLKE